MAVNAQTCNWAIVTAKRDRGHRAPLEDVRLRGDPTQRLASCQPSHSCAITASVRDDSTGSALRFSCSIIPQRAALERTNHRARGAFLLPRKLGCKAVYPSRLLTSPSARADFGRWFITHTNPRADFPSGKPQQHCIVKDCATPIDSYTSLARAVNRPSQAQVGRAPHGKNRQSCLASKLVALPSLTIPSPYGSVRVLLRGERSSHGVCECDDNKGERHE
jgi:hypothetical protein